MDEVRNAIIEKVSLSSDDHGCLSSWVHIDYGDCGHQGFGGYALYLPKSFTHHARDSVAGHWIYRVMEIAGVEDWNKIQGNAVRAKLEGGMIVALGHITKNDWFEPRIDFK